MAQDITLLGASYQAVPAVTLPKTGGGTASFTDVTDTTAAAADVATGKYFYTAAGVRTEGTSSGGGGSGQSVTGSVTLDTSANTLSFVCSFKPDIVSVYRDDITKVIAEACTLDFSLWVGRLLLVRNRAANGSATTWSNLAVLNQGQANIALDTTISNYFMVTYSNGTVTVQTRSNNQFTSLDTYNYIAVKYT